MDQHNMDNSLLSDEEDAQKNKAMGILAYILFFIPIIAARDSKFAMYHANQGLILFIASIILWIVVQILSSILFSISFGLWGLVTTLTSLVSLGILILVIIGIVNAANGKMQPLPIIGGFQIIK
ncbi:MAG: hypothetical protein WAO23_08210 [Dethiobacteria bacterium]